MLFLKKVVYLQRYCFINVFFSHEKNLYFIDYLAFMSSQCRSGGDQDYSRTVSAKYEFGGGNRCVDY